MADAADHVRFLVRSDNRWRVLDALAESPRTRDDVREALDLTRVTLRRVLNGLEDRGWIERNGDRLAATPEGEFVRRELCSTLDALALYERLGGAFRFLPLTEFDFHAARLADARITLLGDESVVIDPLARTADLLRDAREATVLAGGIAHAAYNAHYTAVTERDQSFVGVLSSPVVDVIASDPTFRRWAREMIDTGRASFLRYGGNVPPTMPMVAVLDDGVLLGLADGANPVGILESDDRAVVGWAEGYVADRREDAEALGREVFAER